MKHEQLINLTKKLVSFKSVKENYQERKNVINFVSDYFMDTSAKIRKFNNQHVDSIIISNSNGKKLDIIFSAHLDVVPAEDSQFKLIKKGSRIYGRGVADNKGSAALMMILVKELLQENPNFTFGLMLTTDEERGGENGVGYLIKKVGYIAKVVLLPDLGDKFELIHASKGVLQFTIQAKGKAAHGSRPYLGDNALDKLINVYLAIKTFFPIRLTEKNNWQNSINLGVLTGGEAGNKVPDLAEMKLDIRFIWNDDASRIKQDVEKIIDQEKGVKIIDISFGELMLVDKKNEYLLTINKAAKKILGKPMKIGKETGACDGRFFSAKGVPVLAFAANCGNIHGKGEWLDVNSQIKLYKIYREFLKDINKNH